MNLLYVNPAKTDLQRIKAQKQGKNLQKKLFINFLLGQFFLLIFLTFFLGMNNLSAAANKYMSISIFILGFASITIIQPFFSVFYEDKETSSLISLPISEKEIFVSKLLTLISNSIGLFLSYILINIFSSIQFSHFNIVAVLLILVYSVALFSLWISLIILIFSSLSKIKLFIKYKKTFNTGIQTISFLLVFGFYGAMNALDNSIVSAKDYKGDFLFNIVANPLATNSLIKILAIVLLLVIAMILLNKFVIKTYFEDIIKVKTSPKKEIKKLDKNEKINLIKIYKGMTLKSFSNGSLITQVLLTPLFIPMLFLGFIIALIGNPYFKEGLAVIPTAIMISIIFGIAMYGHGSLSFLSISVDYKNYEFLKTLPINIRQYLLVKYRLSIILQILPALLVYSIILLILGVDLIFFITSLITFLIVSLSYETYGFNNDLEKPFTGWGNITQLMLRGKTGLKQWLIFSGFLLVFALILTITVFYTIYLPKLWWLLTLIYIIILLALAFEIFNKFFKLINIEK
ncbi:hypothetical protein KMP11_05915 [Gemella sp. zg-570]|uniref:hypothetical protein n=1 Tax=Gemella sp. zg-570 TaxID=2840371 RepID=UPI001C0B1113|nr:hypothetical protein [Gemella sp. zg-570]QWQ38488.1 hypothetical protein KMP11_05915 [Gemella sp. zg-570]